MPPPKFNYQTLQVPRRAPFVGRTSARGRAVGAGVQLVHKAAWALNRYAVSYRIDRELQRIAPQIEKAMSIYENQFKQSRPQLGVLVVAAYKEWAVSDVTGQKARTFLSIHLGGTGESHREVFNKYRNRSNLVQGAEKGWVRVDQFIWVTRKR